MSADNGFVLRRNVDQKYVLQEYNASADTFPSIKEQSVLIFNTTEEALTWYETTNPYSEYGLTVRVATVTQE